MVSSFRGALLVLTACASLAGAASAEAATAAGAFYINGAGFGHGVGMSQYGALGFAQHGFGYRTILAHYYRDTTLGQVSPKRPVTVLLKNGAAAFRGADNATGGTGSSRPAGQNASTGAGRTLPGGGGSNSLRVGLLATPALIAAANQPVKLKPGITYSVLVSGRQLELVAGGRKIAKLPPPLVVSGGGPLTLVGTGSYHGALAFLPRPGGGVQTINVVDLEDYIRGVIGAEMPSNWPAQALEAQAVAARTYAIAVSPAASAFDVYADTRSQMYRGVAAETPSTDAAEAATRGQVVEYAGQPATTYFFASSGGYTESVQNVFLGLTPEAWLVGVPDPYDDADGNPYYRWRDNMSIGSAARTLGKLVKGSLLGIKVLEHGVSPRILQAAVVGTNGTITVTGARLRQVFGLRSTYASFTTITTRSVSSTTVSVAPTRTTPAPKSQPPASGGAPKAGTPKRGATTVETTTVTVTTPVVPSPPTNGTVTTGPSGSTTAQTTTTGGGGVGAAIRARLAARNVRRVQVHHALQGIAFPALAGETVVAERLVTGGWTAVGSRPVTASGAYDIPVVAAGLYRVVFRGVDGPAVSVD